jgi:integrase
MRGDGRVFQRGSAWWISYYAPKDGRSLEQREPAFVVDGAGRVPRPARNETEARRALKKRRDEIGAHRIGAQAFRGPAQERLLFSDLLTAVEKDYSDRRLASLPQLRSHLKHVRDHFDGYRALAVDSAAVSAYIVRRRGEQASEASIQRELEAIRRAFSLAAEQKKLSFVPVVQTLNIGNTNAREGFLSAADFEALVAQLGEYQGRGKHKHFVPDMDLQDFARFAFSTGMRKGEIARLTWDAFNRETWTLRLHARDAKGRHGRTLALEGQLRTIIERRLKVRRLDQPRIFHRDGQAVQEFRKAWATACKRAGTPGVIFHDLRRSAIRNMVRAGVDPAVAMKISGHRTRSTFDRYNIVSEDDLRAAMTKTEAYVSTLATERTSAPIRRAQD